MKASELIKILQDNIKDKWDVQVGCYDIRDGTYIEITKDRIDDSITDRIDININQI